MTKKYDFVKEYKAKLEEILPKEVPYLENVGYNEKIGFFFNLSGNFEIDTMHLEDVLNANGLAILSVMGIGNGSYIVAPDLDEILGEED